MGVMVGRAFTLFIKTTIVTETLYFSASFSGQTVKLNPGQIYVVILISYKLLYIPTHGVFLYAVKEEVIDFSNNVSWQKYLL